MRASQEQQPSAPQRLTSERVVVEAPMSFTGSAKRAWRLTRLGSNAAWKVLTIPLALLVIAAWWCVIVGWYVVFGLLAVPYRLLRRGSRKRKAEARRHREQLDAINRVAERR